MNNFSRASLGVALPRVKAFFPKRCFPSLDRHTSAIAVVECFSKTLGLATSGTPIYVIIKLITERPQNLRSPSRAYSNRFQKCTKPKRENLIMKTKTCKIALTLLVILPLTGYAAPIVNGFNSNTLAPNDDGSTGLVNIGFDVNFFGVTSSQLYVNNNGNVTFDSQLSTFTPFDLTSTGRQIIAPFFADVDTRNAGNPVTYGTGTFEGRDAFGTNWINVDYFASSTDHTNRNSFQLILVDRADIANGDFDFIFNYGQIQWETGTASGGSNDGLGGSSARVGYSNGTGDAGTFFELNGSAINGAFLDGGPNALISNRRNSSMDGRYIFSARNGDVVIDNPPVATVPAPGILTLIGVGLLGLTATRRRRRYQL